MQVLVLLYVLSEAKRLQSVSKKTINITAKIILSHAMQRQPFQFLPEMSGFCQKNPKKQ